MGLNLETSAMGSIGQDDPILYEWRVAIVLDAKLPPGRLANAAAVIAVGLGAALPALGGTHAQDRYGRVGSGCSRLPIPVLEADESQRIALLAKIFPLPDGAVAVPFPAFAAAVHDHAEYLAALAERDLAAGPLIGLGVAGPTRWVRSLTGSFRLLR
jgi:hypothetical protein